MVRVAQRICATHMRLRNAQRNAAPAIDGRTDGLTYVFGYLLEKILRKATRAKNHRAATLRAAR